METLLPRCLDSLIVNEGIEKLEIWVVNDGSKDKSSDIGHQYEYKYPGIINVIDKNNGNYGSCINAALPRCTGKYVKVLDSDDYFNSETLIYDIEILENLDVDLMINDFEYVSERRKHKKKQSYSIPSNTIMHLSEIIGMPNVISAIQMHAIIYNKKIFDGMWYKQSECMSYTDQEWVFEPIARCQSCYYLDRPLYFYNICREGQTMDRSQIIKNYDSIIRMTENLILTYEKAIGLTVCNNDYLKRRLLEIVKTRYRQCLLTYKKNINEEVIISFDSFLNTHASDIYKELDGEYISSLFAYKYVRDWRNENNILFRIFSSCVYYLNMIRLSIKK